MSRRRIDAFDESWEAFKEVIECHQDPSDNLAKFPFRILQWNQSQPLPPSERKSLTRLSQRLLAHHDKLSPLLIFDDESFDIHAALPPVPEICTHIPSLTIPSCPTLFDDRHVNALAYSVP